LFVYKLWCYIFQDIFNYESRWNIEIFNWCDQVSSILWLILYWIWQSTMWYWHSDARRLFNFTILTCHFLFVSKFLCYIFQNIFNYTSRWKINYNWYDQVLSILCLIPYWNWQNIIKYWDNKRKLILLKWINRH
jgi:hypothetical protein